LITDLTIVNVDASKRDLAIAQYRRVRNMLEDRGIVVGTYISGTSVTPAAERRTYPPTAVDLADLPPGARYVGSWPSEPNRKIIDVTDLATRHAFQARLRVLWEALPAPVRFVDNAAVHPAVGNGQPWQAYCQNMEEIRKIGESLGSRVIFNISLHVGTLSDEQTRELIQAVGHGGIALEMPWHPNIRRSKQATQSAVQRYRQLLDSGMGIILVSADGTPASELRAWVTTWRRPDDHLYVAGSFWKPPDMNLYSMQ